MKKILLLSLLATSLIGSDSPPRHEAVVLWAQQNAEGGVYSGASVYCSSSSRGAITFPQFGQGQPLTDLAEAIAQLRSNGYQLHISDNGLFVSAIK